MTTEAPQCYFICSLPFLLELISSWFIYVKKRKLRSLVRFDKGMNTAAVRRRCPAKASTVHFTKKMKTSSCIIRAPVLEKMEGPCFLGGI